MVAVAQPVRPIWPFPSRVSAETLRAGGGAVALWFAAPVLVVQAMALPPFLLMAIAFVVAFLAALARQLWAGPAIARLRPPAGMALRALPALLAALLLWVLALRIAFGASGGVLPWPVLTAFADPLTGLARPAAGLAAAGLALGGAACCGWILPVLQRAGAPVDIQFGWLCGAAAPVALLLHLCLEPRLAVPAAALLAAAALGAGPLGAGLWLWARAAGRGAFTWAPQPAAAGR